ncbi:MAG: hypothetical protein WDO73_32135 [Ignavibacteriota bacterium]
MRKLATSLRVAQASAEEEARLRGTAQAHWTAERLRVYIGTILRDSRLFVVSNREPYEHVREGGSITVKVPASGLVTGAGAHPSSLRRHVDRARRGRCRSRCGRRERSSARAA